MELRSWQPGLLTDDTQLSLGTCEAIEEGGTITPETVAARFLDLFRRGKLRWPLFLTPKTRSSEEL